MSKITRCAPGACLLVITSHTRQPAWQGGLSITRGSGLGAGKLGQKHIEIVSGNRPRRLLGQVSGLFITMILVWEEWIKVGKVWLIIECWVPALTMQASLESAGGCWKKCCEVLWKETRNAARNATRKGDQINKKNKGRYVFINCLDKIIQFSHVLWRH